VSTRIERPTTSLPPPAQPPRSPSKIRQIAALLGVIGFAASFAASWIPSFWGDEGASVMSAERSLPSLFRMLGNIDAVHGTYYLFLHGWISLFGASPLSVRLPSAIAVGCAVAGTVVLTNRLASRRLAVIAGIVCIVLPRITYMGEEARSYAFSTAFAVWLTVLLVELLARRVTGWLAWLGYAAGFTLGTYVFLYFTLLGIAHGIVVLLSTRYRRLILRWIAAAGITLLASAPIIYWGFVERGQIAFMATEDAASFGRITVDQWFENVPLAILGWALIAVAIGVTASRSLRRKKDSSFDGGERVCTPMPSLFVVAVSWFAVPSIVLLIANYAVFPTYTVRYLSMSTPAVAILIALAIGMLGRRWLSLVMLALIVALAIPSYIFQRTPYSKPGEPDWQQVSALMGRFAHPGDAVVFDDSIRPSRRIRQAMQTYPAGFQGLNDIALSVPFQDSTGIRGIAKPLADVTEKLAGVDHVWLLEYRGSPQNKAGTDSNLLEQLGYTRVKTIPVHSSVIYEFSKGSP
jgi:mannosyltransferase